VKLRYIILILIFFTAVTLKISDTFNLVDLSDRKVQFEKVLSERLNLKFDFYNAIVLKFFPYPHIFVPGAKISYDERLMFDISGMKISISPDKIIHFFANSDNKNFFIAANEQISVTDALLYMSTFSTYAKENHDKVNVFGKFNFNFNLQKLNIINFGNTVFARTEELNLENVKLNFNNDNVLSSEGEIKILANKINYNIKLSQERKKKNIDFNLNGIGLKFDLKLNEFDYKDFTLKDGKINLNIDDFNTLFKGLGGIIINEDRKLPAIKLLSISSDIKSSANGKIFLDNPLLSSQVFDTPTFDVKAYKVSDDIIESQISFNSKKLDLDVLRTNNLASSNLLSSNIYRILQTMDLNSNLNFNLETKVDKIVLDEAEMKDFHIRAYKILEKILFNKIHLSFPGDSEFNVEGVLQSNFLRKKFFGDFSMESKDINNLLDFRDSNQKGGQKYPIKMTSKIIAMRNIIKIFHGRIIGDNDLNLNYNSIFYNIPYTAPTKRLSISGRNLDLNALNTIDPFNQYIKKLYLADSDKTNEEYFKLTKTDDWIRCFDKHLHFEMNINNLKFGDNIIDNVTGIIDVKPSALHVRNLSFKDDRISGNVNFSLKLPVLRPQIRTSAEFEYLDWNFFKEFFPSLSYLDSSHSTKINFFSANSYDGTLNVKIKKLFVNDDVIPEDINASAELRLGYMLIKDFNYKLWNGLFQNKGAIFVSNYIPPFKLNFNVFNLNPKMPFKMITGADKVDGYISLAGNLSGGLNNFDDIKKLDGKIDFEGAQITWNGIGLNNIIELVDGPYTAQSKIEGIDYYAKYGQTKFDDVKGSAVGQKGLFQVDNTSLATNRIAGIYSMNYDLPSNALNGVGAFAFVPTGSQNTLLIKTTTSGTFPEPQKNEVDYSQVSDFIKNSGKK
jgi:hypothetical protein